MLYSSQAIEGNIVKAKIFKFIIFLLVWWLIFLIIDNNFVILALLIAYLFVYSIGKNALFFLANEFDKNHNALADNVRDLREQIEFLKEDKELLENKVQELRDEINEFKPNNFKEFDSF